MSSHYSIHHPADAMPGGAGTAGAPEKPVVLAAFAKLVMMVGVIVLFIPFWLGHVGDLAYGPPPVAWVSLRMTILGGVGLLVTLGVLILKVWSGLLKHLARAD